MSATVRVYRSRHILPGTPWLATCKRCHYVSIHAAQSWAFRAAQSHALTHVRVRV